MSQNFTKCSLSLSKNRFIFPTRDTQEETQKQTLSIQLASSVSWNVNGMISLFWSISI